MRLRAVPAPPPPPLGDFPPVPARKKPDVVVPLLAAAFALGIVLASVGALALHVTGGDTVPAREHREVVTQLAAERATTVAQRARLEESAAALDQADALARRLVAALDSPGATAEQIAELRRAVSRQSVRIERTLTRVVPGPVVTAPPAAPARDTSPPRAQRPSPAPSPAPGPPASAAPQSCIAQIVGVLCVERARP